MEARKTADASAHLFYLARWLHNLVALFGALAVASPAISAEIKTDATVGLPYIYLSGEIDARTPGRLEEVLKEVQPKVEQQNINLEHDAPSEKGQLAALLGATLFLDSGGGDIVAAIKAGEIARNHHVSAIVAAQSTCASACVLLLCGGVSRTVLGDIGIHRPFSAAYSSSLSESEQRYRAVSASVDQYLRLMNMPPHLFDAMNAVPPDQIRWLTEAELTEFGVGEDDPVWRDRYDSVQARAIGISKQEYYARKHRAREQCRGIQDGVAYGKCYLDIVGFPK